jgi:hypothetical protein
MGYEAALKKHPKDHTAGHEGQPDSSTVEVDLGGRKVQIRQQTVASGIGVGIGRRLKRLFG